MVLKGISNNGQKAERRAKQNKNIVNSQQETKIKNIDNIVLKFLKQEIMVKKIQKTEKMTLYIYIYKGQFPYLNLIGTIIYLIDLNI